MRKRIFRSMCLLALTAVILTSVLVSAMVYARSFTEMKTQVQREAALISVGLSHGGEDYLGALQIDYGDDFRITRIRRDGMVLFDSDAEPGRMENHLSRPEVQAVLSGQWSGEAVRRSETMDTKTYYYALALADGTVLRLASTMRSAFGAVLSVAPLMVFIAVVVLLLTLLLARRMANLIIGPLNALDLEHPERDGAYEELSPLLSRIAQQNRSIGRQMRQLTARQEEFRLLSENMSEGLLLLDRNAAILTINNSAQALLGGDADRDYASQHFLQLSRDLQLQKLIEKALGGDRAEDTLPFRGRQYQVIASPVTADETIRGALLLFLDVTERQQAEQMRREFSANVSHELKTPLTSISGYAEMLAGGMVRDGDIKMFAGRIYSEAGRLLALIQDIIKLSRLDEGTAQEQAEPVDLYEVAKQVVERLALPAAERQVAVTVEGEPTVVLGAPAMLDELMFNLCDNAVKYNKAGGSVTVSARPTRDGACLAVRDTGIGIPHGLTERVFERFYRVDKSRSKDTGGTGLGLSIVKHIAQIHGAQVSIESKEQVGTCIRVKFPPN
ncbi:PAS domain S-box protein [Intestinibacillus massiliensis]|nr:PAS domain S-box protein [Intestinibacillus massiliensis]